MLVVIDMTDRHMIGIHKDDLAERATPSPLLAQTRLCHQPQWIKHWQRRSFKSSLNEKNEETKLASTVQIRILNGLLLGMLKDCRL